MSTLISDLDGTPGQGDDSDFVQNILREMNADGGGGGGGMAAAPPPAIGSQVHGTVINAPNPNTIAPRVMDSGPITAHMIGNSHPSAADFVPIMGGGGGGGGGAGGPAPMAASQGDIWAGNAASYAQGPSPQPYIPRPAKKSFFTKVIEEFKGSLLVTILVFVFSLPVVNFLFAHYLPAMVKPTGELTPIGLGVKALIAGGAFWVLQRVIVPLLTL
jgi:hypothetical protein